jgi:hypothetical protein
MPIYILILNNGEEWEDYNDWVGGIFSSEEDAVTFATKNTPHSFRIEEWELGKERYTNYSFYEVHPSWERRA